MAYPAAFEYVAQSVTKGQFGKFTKKPAKGSTPDDYGKNAAKTAASNPWLKGVAKSSPPRCMGTEGGTMERDSIFLGGTQMGVPAPFRF